MNRLILILVAFVLGNVSVHAQIQYRMSATGLNFYMAEDKEGPQARMGQLVSLNMSIQDANGKFLKNTFQDPKPLMFPVKYSAFEGDIYEAVSLMSEGDSTLFLISADSMYKHIFRKEMPADLKSGSMLDVRIRVFKIWDQEERINELEKHADTLVSAEEKARRVKENQEIEKYWAGLGYELNKTKSGVYWTYFSEGKGEKIAETGTTVIMNFTGKLLNGAQFETSYDEEGNDRPVFFLLGRHDVILGWEDVAEGKKEGDRVFCVVPSHLAFGAQAKGNIIPANSTLVFELDIMGVR